MLRTLPAEDPTVGDRAVTTELTLVEILAGLAADRERVVLVTRAGGDSVTGELRSVGQDVAVLRTDAQPPATVYVPLASVAEITLCLPGLRLQPSHRTWAGVTSGRRCARAHRSPCPSAARRRPRGSRERRDGDR